MCSGGSTSKEELPQKAKKSDLKQWTKKPDVHLKVYKPRTTILLDAVRACALSLNLQRKPISLAPGVDSTDRPRPLRPTTSQLKWHRDKNATDRYRPTYFTTADHTAVKVQGEAIVCP